MTTLKQIKKEQFLKVFKELAINAFSEYPIYQGCYLNLSNDIVKNSYFIDDGDLVLNVCSYNRKNLTNKDIFEVLKEFDFLAGYDVVLQSNQKYVKIEEIDS